ncbi:peroxisomal ATPase PEX1-like [Ornithodoros turicata]|uniref:peroxisomal ATPase PEX1-like n=1 Tax=Ornithodoros turicata TaxID=34597 RepID=UPI003138C89B
MGFMEVAALKFSDKKTCFISIPRDWTNLPNLVKDNLPVYEISTISEQKCYFSWNGDYSVSTQWRAAAPSVNINAVLAQQLGFTEGQEVVVCQKSETLHQCRQVILKPVVPGDWEILNINHSFVENNLMNQIRVIWCGMVFPVWVHSNVYVLVKVASMTPSVDPVLLVNNTEVVVVPDLGEQPNPRPYLSSSVEPSTTPQPANVISALKSLVSSVSSTVSRAILADGTTSSSSQESETLLAASEASPTDFSIQHEPSLVCFDDVSIVGRALPSTLLLQVEDLPDGISEGLLAQPTTVFISRTLLGGHFECTQPITYLAKITKLVSSLEKSLKSETKAKEETSSEKALRKLLDCESAVVRVLVVPLTWTQFDFLHGTDTVFVSDVLRRQIGLEFAKKVALRSTSSPAHVVESITLHPVMRYDPATPHSKVVSSFKQWVSSCTGGGHPLVVSSGLLVMLMLENNQQSGFLLKVNLQKVCTQKSSGVEFGFLSGNLPGIDVNVGDSTTPQSSRGVKPLPVLLLSDLNPERIQLDLDMLGGVSHLFKQGLSHLAMATSLSPFAKQLKSDLPLSSTVLLITGQKGSGKSTLARAFAAQLSRFPSSVHVCVMQCTSLRGKRADKVGKEWEKVVAECVFRQPSVFILDDLDVIAGSVAGPEQESSPDALYFSRMADVFLGTLRNLRYASPRVAVIATGRSWEAFHPKLTASHGNHVFYTTLNIDGPSKRERREILECLVRQRPHLSQGFNPDEISANTEGCYARDLLALLDRATHSAWLRSAGDGGETVVLTDDDFQYALEGFCPSTLRGLNLKAEETLRWDDAGGLADVKQALQEVFLWPVKYPNLFVNSPIRPLSGLLLYGAPGTGKTLLAGIVASECGVNFISIKGPELLSKYIGASEQAVRAVFQRAQSAKPCIIFFDEFDSIAPRRGHDSTGVTDRVVNQLLTLLDGVESSSGVYILAATSRPDLIDPALLRPGRLDKCLYCPLPNEEERASILHALSRKLDLADDVDLRSIARRTDFFTGADLQSLLYTAQLQVVHETYPKGNQTAVPTELRSSDESFFCAGPPIDDGQLLHEVSALSQRISSPNRRRTRTESSGVAFTVHQRHLEASLNQTKASVTPLERQRFNNIYTSFRSPSAVGAGQRVTLA